jgi:fluoride exporter
MWKSIVAIGLGASAGALLRWWLGDRLNAAFPLLPPGTLAANILGGYIIGAAVAFFATFPALPAEWRLFLITGFCGGLTTFSTFSAEVVGLLQRGQPLWALAEVCVHVAASLLVTAAGMATVLWVRAITS